MDEFALGKELAEQKADIIALEHRLQDLTAIHNKNVDTIESDMGSIAERFNKVNKRVDKSMDYTCGCAIFTTLYSMACCLICLYCHDKAQRQIDELGMEQTAFRADLEAIKIRNEARHKELVEQLEVLRRANEANED